MGTADRLKSPTKQKAKPQSVIAPSQIQSTPSTSGASSHPRSISSAFHNVRSLPRKASRLMCMGGDHSCRKPHDASEVCPSTGQCMMDLENGCGDTGTIVEKDRSAIRGIVQAGAIDRSSSESSSGSGSTSNGYAQSSSSYVITPSSSATSSVLDKRSSPSLSSHQKTFQNVTQNKPTLGGPILSPAELAKALEKYAAVSEPQTMPSSANYEVSFPVSPTTPLADPGSLFSSASTQDPIPRALSPPPEHFRRRERVLSNSGMSVTGSIGPGSGLGPYTTPSPMNSPPCSPRANQLRLHELLSCESLVAPKMSLYNSAVDSDSGSDEEGDARSVKSDFGVHPNSRKRVGMSGQSLTQWQSVRGVESILSTASTQTNASLSSSSRRDDKDQTKYHTLRSHSRLHSPGPPIEDGQEPHTLRRVFSR